VGTKSKVVEEGANLQETREFVFSDRMLRAGEEARSKLFCHRCVGAMLTGFSLFTGIAP